MEELERRLRFAMVAYVGGCRPAVEKKLVLEALAVKAGVPEDAVSVHEYALEDFLVVFGSEECRNRVAAMPFIEHKGISLFFRQWTRQAQAVKVAMRSKVELAIEGIPPHAWDMEVAEAILGTACAVTEVAPETRSREDMALFKLVAWTSDLEAVPVARTLLVPEPEEEEEVSSPAREHPEDSHSPTRRQQGVPEEVGMLKYRVLVHMTKVEEDELSDDCWVWPGASDGSCQSGIPGPESEDGRGGGGRCRRTSRTLSWSRRVPDRRGGPGQHGQKLGLQSANLRTDWRLPQMEGPGGEFGRLCAARKVAFDPLGRDLQKRVAASEAGKAVVLRRRQLTSEVQRSGAAMHGRGGSFSVDTRTCSLEADRHEGLDTPSSDSAGDSEGGGYIQVSLSNGVNTHDVAGDDGAQGADDFHDAMTGEASLSGIGLGEVPAHSYAGPDSNMQLVERDTGALSSSGMSPREEAQSCDGMSPRESIAFGKLRAFYACIVKTLAPPLLKEVQAASKLSAGAPPFTPRRTTGSSGTLGSTPALGEPRAKKASAADTVLLKALGIVPAEMAVHDGDLEVFGGMFDSPMREDQLRVVVSVFGKVVPPSFEVRDGCQLVEAA
ncbi:unnamed protein product [Alopecurus aequalis]